MNVFTALNEAYNGLKYQGGAMSASDQKKSYDKAKGPGQTPAPAAPNGSLKLGQIHRDRLIDSVLDDRNGAWSLGSSEEVNHGNTVIPNPLRNR